MEILFMRVRFIPSIAILALVAACHPRAVEVRTAPTTSAQAQTSVQVKNGLNQAVNVYVTQAGTDMFLRQVPANSTSTVPVQGVSAGTSVTLKAVTVDGVRTFQRKNVTLTGTYLFPLP
jgi:hypothetical protein